MLLMLLLLIYHHIGNVNNNIIMIMYVYSLSILNWYMRQSLSH